MWPPTIDSSNATTYKARDLDVNAIGDEQKYFKWVARRVIPHMSVALRQPSAAADVPMCDRLSTFMISPECP